MDQSEVVDLQWITEHPPEARLSELRREEEWDRIMEAHGVYRRSEDGQRILGTNGERMEEYDASRYEILAGRMRIGSRGDVIPYDAAKGHLLPLPAANQPLTFKGKEGRKVFLFSLSDRAKALRLTAIEHLAASGAMLSEWEKEDLEYLKSRSVKKF